MSRSQPTPIVHVLPWTRAIGRRFLAGWLAITIGDHTISWRPLEPAELAHEACHVAQWRRYGLRFIARYGRASWRAWRAGGSAYGDNAFEVAARAAAARAAAGPVARGAPGPPAGSE